MSNISKIIVVILFLGVCVSNVSASEANNEEQKKTLHIFLKDRDQIHDLGGKSQADMIYHLVWHYLDDVDSFEKRMSQGMPSNQEQAVAEMKRRIKTMTDADKALIGKAWRSRAMAEDLGLMATNVPAVWVKDSGQIFKGIEDLRHVFSQIR